MLHGPEFFTNNDENFRFHVRGAVSWEFHMLLQEQRGKQTLVRFKSAASWLGVSEFG